MEIDFKQIIEKQYKDWKEFNSDSFGTNETELIIKCQFLASEIFDFTFYDAGVDEIIVPQMIDVCKAILNQKTFAYQETSQQHYITFLLMCNMPFLNNKLEWGTSIRGAWFDEYQEYKINGIDIPLECLSLFINDLIKFYEPD